MRLLNYYNNGDIIVVDEATDEDCAVMQVAGYDAMGSRDTGFESKYGDLARNYDDVTVFERISSKQS